MFEGYEYFYRGHLENYINYSLGYSAMGNAIIKDDINYATKSITAADELKCCEAFYKLASFKSFCNNKKAAFCSCGINFAF